MLKKIIMKQLIVKIIMLGAVSTFAVPEFKKEHFDNKLSELNWQIESGSSDGAKVVKNKLLIRSDITLKYRYYELRSLKTRHPFGDFSVEANFDCKTYKGNFSWGVTVNGSRLFIQVDPRKKQARLVYTSDNNKHLSPWTSASDTKQTYRLKFIRTGSNLYFISVNSSGTRTIGAWHGDIPPIFDFFVKTDSNNGQLVVSKWEMTPLPKINGYFTVKTNYGKRIDFKGDRKFEDIGGGGLNNGYLWSQDQKAELKIDLNNPSIKEKIYELHLVISDWMDKELERRKYKVHVKARSQEEVTVGLFNERYGFYNAALRLYLDNEPVGAEQVIGYGITAALKADKIADNSVLGIHSYPFSKLGIKHVRYWDNGGRAVCWSGIQPEKDKWDFGGIDAYVNKTLAAGMTPLVVLGMTPKWASSNPGGKSHRGPGAYSPPVDINDWRIFCRKMASRYKGRVMHYEIWNEPNNNGLKPKGFFFHDSVYKYFELLKTAYEELKAVDPYIKVVAPSATGSFFAFVDKLLELGGGNYFDILSIHTYTAPFPPEIGYQFNQEKSYHDRVSAVHKMMRKYKISKPVWNTEVGYHSGMRTRVGGRFITTDIIADEGLDDSWPNWKKRWSFRPLDPRRTAAFYSRFGILSIMYGVERVYIHHRLIDPGKSPYISAPALGWMNNILGGAVFVRRINSPSNVNMLLFKLADSQYCIVGYQIYPESLFMKKNDKNLTDIDSAPVSEFIGEQKGMEKAAKRALKRKSYFEPGSLHYISVQADILPDECFDMWGNKISGNRIMLDENPLYMKYKSNPEKMKATYYRKEGEINLARSIKDRFKGKIMEGAQYHDIIADLGAFLGKSINISFKKMSLSDGSKLESSKWPCLKAGQKISFKVPERAVGKVKILLTARSGKKYDYFLDFNGKKIKLEQWPVWPDHEVMSGKTWKLMKSLFISPEISLKTDMELSIQADTNNSHIFKIQICKLDE